MSLFGGLFGSLYSKEGPGVEKDEPKKPGFTRYFENFFRKFSKMIQLNLIFLVPALIVGAAMYFLYFGQFVVTFNIGTNLISVDLWKRFVFPLPLILLCPCYAGLTFVTRNYVREEHAFIFSDFMEAIKNNWKFFLLNGIVIYVFYFVFSFAFDFYFYLMFSNWLLFIPFIISAIAVFLFLSAQFYIPLMFVTFKLTFKQVYRNAFIFAVVAFPRNLLLIFLGILVLAFYFLVTPMMFLIELLFYLVVILFGFSLFSYTINFLAYPVLEKYLINGGTDEAEERKKKEAEEKKKSSILSEEEFNSISEIKSEYVYISGKLVKRSELEEKEEK